MASTYSVLELLEAEKGVRDISSYTAAGRANLLVVAKEAIFGDVLDTIKPEYRDTFNSAFVGHYYQRHIFCSTVRMFRETLCMEIAGKSGRINELMDQLDKGIFAEHSLVKTTGSVDTETDNTQDVETEDTSGSDSLTNVISDGTTGVSSLVDSETDDTSAVADDSTSNADSAESGSAAQSAYMADLPNDPTDLTVDDASSGSKSSSTSGGSGSNDTINSADTVTTNSSDSVVDSEVDTIQESEDNTIASTDVEGSSSSNTIGKVLTGQDTLSDTESTRVTQEAIAASISIMAAVVGMFDDNFNQYWGRA